MLETFVLARLARIGDKVVMQMTEDSRYWGGKGVPDGTPGVVIGFSRYTTYNTYNSLNVGETPGVYEGNGAIIVKWADGDTEMVTPHWLAPVNQEVLAVRKNDSEYNDAFESMQRISDLPELKYFVGNLVRLKEPFFTDGEEFVVCICGIDYFRVSGSSVRYIVSLPGQAGCTRSVSDDDIVELVEKGNYQLWWIDRKTIGDVEIHKHLKFESLEDEVSFFRSLGYLKDVRSPKSGTFRWGVDEAFEAAMAGEVSVVGVSSGLFGSARWPTAGKLLEIPGNPDLEQRLRQKYAEERKSH